MLIRCADKDDAESIYEIGMGSSAFRVNDEIRFYEFHEVVAWLDIVSPK
ncbi:MAG: hypothetical protein SGJ02_11525 [bacterium]|nr:hypothetical protein [bacterium]